ncbi:hypothetical protein [Methanolobus profundi]|uniref:Prenyltransferase and squalene oxidase repeat-containing protein n=1 Tax=Methanolobus profundi TaxID=487685 RepID=A0A1I4QNM4_9EURY|nr:hypothetical protein [Methanolobus profundi]SFM41651.1 hypothetical protein SAMN04488696_1117 [Methanolobus profundi]
MDLKSEASFKWLYSQKIAKVKDLARIVQASHLWNEKKHYIEELLNLRTGDSWNCDLRDTSRAVSALALTDMVFPEVGEWLLSKRTGSSWNDDVYDTTYALAALGDMGHYDANGCQWLVDNYGPKWEHPGTTALIINALIRQSEAGNVNSYASFIDERAKWIISQREMNGAWKTLATSNLVIQALILAGYKEVTEGPFNWILSKMNKNCSWGKDNGDINTTSLSLITIHEYTE